MINGLLLLTALSFAGATSAPAVLNAQTNANDEYLSIEPINLYKNEQFYNLSTDEDDKLYCFTTVSLMPSYYSDPTKYDLTSGLININEINVTAQIDCYSFINNTFIYQFTLATNVKLLLSTEDSIKVYDYSSLRTTVLDVNLIPTWSMATDGNTLTFTYSSGNDNKFTGAKYYEFALNKINDLNYYLSLDGTPFDYHDFLGTYNFETKNLIVNNETNWNSLGTTRQTYFLNQLLAGLSGKSYTRYMFLNYATNSYTSGYASGYSIGYSNGYDSGQLNPTTLSWLKGTVSLVYQLFDFPLMGSITLGGVIGAFFLILIFAWIIRWFR